MNWKFEDIFSAPWIQMTFAFVASGIGRASLGSRRIGGKLSLGEDLFRKGPNLQGSISFNFSFYLRLITLQHVNCKDSMQQKWPNRDERSAAYQKPETESQRKKCNVDTPATYPRTWQQKAKIQVSFQEHFCIFLLPCVGPVFCLARLVQSGVRSPQAGPTNRWRCSSCCCISSIRMDDSPGMKKLLEIF